MKASVASLVLAGMATTAAAAKQTILSGQFTADTLRASTAPNAVAMPVIHQRKLDLWERQRAQGVFDVDRYASAGPAKCLNGTAGEYKCHKVDLAGFLRHQDTNSRTREGNDIWGTLRVSGEPDRDGLHPGPFPPPPPPRRRMIC